MQKNHQLYFAPYYTFLDLAKATDPFEIVNAYRDRINGFYLEPAKIIIESKEEDGAFAAGLICFTAIDAIAKTVTRKRDSHKRFVEWMQKNLGGNSLSKKEVGNIYDEFRNGLVHEARIKNGSQFTYGVEDMIDIRNGITYINPKVLLKQTRLAFNKFIDEMEGNIEDTLDFAQRIIDDFELDIQFTEEKIACKNCGKTGKDPATEEICQYCNGSGYDLEGNYEREMGRAEDEWTAKEEAERRGYSHEAS